MAEKVHLVKVADWTYLRLTTPQYKRFLKDAMRARFGGNPLIPGDTDDEGDT